MASENPQKFDRTFRDLEVAVAELSDRNLTRVLGFIVEALGAHPDASLADFFSEEHRTDTLVKLRSVASDRWSRKTTLQSELSRISKLAKVAEDLIARSNSMHDGSDPDFLRALDAIRGSMTKRNIESAYALDVAAFGAHLNFVGHLLSKKRKYHPNRSKQAKRRLKVLCDFLNLNWQEMKRDLFEQASSKNEKTTLSPSAFEYRMKLSKLSESLQEDILEIVSFHKDASPGRQPDGSAKHRTKKSRWKVRSTDGHCKSEMNFYSLLGSFFGFCVLPEDAEQARARAQARLSKSNISWRKEDLEKYASWMTGLGMKAEELSMGLLFDHNLVEKWLTWSAVRNGGASKTQSTYCIMLCGLMNGRTGAIAQSYNIARKIMNYEKIGARLSSVGDKIKFASRMEEWARECSETAEIYKVFKESFSSSKVKRKRRAVLRHEEILSQENPLASVYKMLQRLHDSEPRHLGTGSTSWMLWVRNVTLVELLISNPLRADNICYLRYAPDGSGTLRLSEGGCEIVLEKHEVKNPHDEEDLGYRGEVSNTAAAWLRYYIETVRPLWATDISVGERLFLTRTGKPVDFIELRSILIRISQQFLPEFPPLNPHIFRHIVATSWLKQHPDDFVTVSLILGDRLATVMRGYAHLASRDGLNRYHKHLAQWRQNYPNTKGGN